jgi:hypothetical protein
LEGDSIEVDLLEAILELLAAQMEQILGVTRWQQQPARKRDYNRVLRLISVRGKTMRRLLRRLAVWTQPGPKHPTPEERSRRNERLEAQMALIRQEALEHQQWLGELRAKPRSEALELLAAEYELPT